MLSAGSEAGNVNNLRPSKNEEVQQIITKVSEVPEQPKVLPPYSIDYRLIIEPKKVIARCISMSNGGSMEEVLVKW